MAAPRIPVREGVAAPGPNPFTDGDGVLYVERTTPALYILKTDGTYQLITSGGGAPSGPAGGDLTGTYPNPTIDVGKVTSAKILDDTILNADINSAAAIAESKLTLATDAAAGTGSRRTLGTGALQAAAGNHTHAGSAVASARANGSGAADFTTSSTSNVNITATALDLVVAAASGDILEYCFTGLIYSAAGTPSVFVVMDVGGTQIPIARTQPSGSIFPIGAFVFQTAIIGGQISGGNVTARPMWRVASGATTAGMENTTALSVPQFSVKNLRQ